MNTMEYVSYVFSFISIIFYSVVYFPQFREIYKTKSTDGISILMLLLWTQADFLSLIGTILNGLNISVIIMGWYHSTIGLCMVSFVWYYKYKSDNMILPTVNDKYNGRYGSIWYELSYIILFFGINICTGLVLNIKNIQDYTFGEILGWITMSLYIIGRFPQIMMNIKRKTTEGLSALMYIFTMCGNTFYVLSLVTYSSESDYIMLNLPWIISSGVTIILDMYVLYQIYYYKNIVQ